MMRPSSAVTDSNYVGLTGRALCAAEDRCRYYRLAVSCMSSPGASDTVTRTGPAVRPAAVPAPRPHHQHDPWLRIAPGGDHPYLDYSEIAPRLQWLRGPRTLEAALVAYDKHFGRFPA
jgi:hypothetical protein